MSYDQIAAQLHISRGQVGYALRRGTVTPKKAKGRPSVLSSDEVQKIVDFVKLNAHNRRLNFLELASGPFRYLGDSERVIKKELNLKGIKRHPAQKCLRLLK